MLLYLIFNWQNGIGINIDSFISDLTCLLQIFDNKGVFRFEINVCGKDDGQLLYPNRVTVCKLTGNIVITERSPTHQVSHHIVLLSYPHNT